MAVAALGRQPRTLVLLAVVLVLCGVAWAQRSDSELPPPPPTVTRPDPPTHDVEWFEVRQADDGGKPGANSVMVQRFLSIDPHTCGVSGDQLRVRFDQPVEVLGVDISVDIGHHLDLVEVMAAVNGRDGYGYEDRAADPLAHTSWSPVGGAPRAIDKATILPAPVSVPADGFVTIGAWLCGGAGSPRVSPEVIVHYRWVTAGHQSAGSLT